MNKPNASRYEYLLCVEELLHTPEVRKLAMYNHHNPANSRLDHCLFVSYLSFLVCRKLGLDSRAAARGGLLHDLFFYDSRDKDKYEGNHLQTHPKVALENAKALCPINELEADIIESHMFPITTVRPKFKESVVVSLVDKACALVECFGLNKFARLQATFLLYRKHVFAE